jgi:hypothetical protein
VSLHVNVLTSLMASTHRHRGIQGQHRFQVGQDEQPRE